MLNYFAKGYKKYIWVAIPVVFITAFFIFNSIVQGKAKSRVDEIIAEHDTYVNITYDDVSTSLLGSTPTVTNVSIQDPNNPDRKIDIDNIVLEGHKQKKEESYPRALNVSVNGVNVPLEALPMEQQRKLKMLGYNSDLKASFNLDYDHDVEKDVLALNNFNVYLHNMFIAQFSFALSAGINIEQMKKNVMLLFFNPERIPTKVGFLKLEYKDDSFLERTIKKQAKDQKMTVEQFVEKSKNEIEGEMADIKNPQMKDYMAAVIKFIENRNSFSASLEVDEPVRLGTMLNMLNHKNFDDLFEKVSLEFSAS